MTSPPAARMRARAPSVMRRQHSVNLSPVSSCRPTHDISFSRQQPPCHVVQLRGHARANTTMKPPTQVPRFGLGTNRQADVVGHGTHHRGNFPRLSLHLLHQLGDGDGGLVRARHEEALQDHLVKFAVRPPCQKPVQLYTEYIVRTAAFVACVPAPVAAVSRMLTLRI
eukprot:2620809-Rhodomonas_salina.1